MKNLLINLFNLKKRENIIYIAALSVFLPYYLTAAVIVVLSVYVLLKTKIMKTVFSHTASWILPVFSAITFTVGIVNKNYFGAMASIACFLIGILGLYFCTIMTTDIFETALDLCCIPPAFILPIVILEKILCFNVEWHRCCGDLFKNMYTSLYFHPNYLASLMATVVLICAYKIVVRGGDKKFYYFISIVSLVIMFLTESMFAWVEVFVGLAVLLLLTPKHQNLVFLLIVATLFCSIIYILPNIFPRILQADGTFENRLMIWDLTIEKIPESLWFGKGFFTYFNICQQVEGAYYTTHAHNLFLEPLSSFGIVGSFLFFALILIVLQRIFICKNLLRKSACSILIISIFTAITIHSLVDMTMLWHQTALLYCIIAAGYGADQKRIRKIFRKQNKSTL